jgi:hypothetical protein
MEPGIAPLLRTAQSSAQRSLVQISRLASNENGLDHEIEAAILRHVDRSHQKGDILSCTAQMFTVRRREWTNSRGVQLSIVGAA